MGGDARFDDPVSRELGSLQLGDRAEVFSFIETVCNRRFLRNTRPSATSPQPRPELHPTAFSLALARGAAVWARLSKAYRRCSAMAIVMSTAGTKVKP